MDRTNRIFVKITSVYLYLLPTVYLLFCGTKGYQSLIRAKFPLFCALCGGYVLVMAVLGAECAVVGALKLPPLPALLKKASPTQRLMLAYLVLTWVSALLSPHWPETVIGASRHEGALTITLYVLCFLLASSFARITPHLLTAFCLSASLFGGLCVLQLAGGNPLSLYPPGYGYADAYTAYSGAYLGTIGNVDLVAAFLCLAIPVFWIGLLRLPGRARLLLLLPLALSVYVLVNMSVLAGLVGVFGGGALAISVVVPQSKKGRRLAAGVLAACVLLSIAAICLLDLPSGLLHELHMLLRGDWNDSFGSGRIYIWKNVLRRVPDRLWFGLGPDTMIHADIPPFTRYDGTFGLIVSHVDMAHNEYLNILFHQGLPALAAYLLALAAAAKKWIRHSAGDPVCAMLGGAVLCYCVQAFFGFSMCITAPFFWLALALLENRTANHNGGE